MLLPPLFINIKFYRWNSTELKVPSHFCCQHVYRSLISFMLVLVQILQRVMLRSIFIYSISSPILHGFPIILGNDMPVGSKLFQKKDYYNSEL